MSDALWQQMFGGDPRVLGSVVTINGTPMTVIGVAPPGGRFSGPHRAVKPTAHESGCLPKIVHHVASHRALEAGVTLARRRCSSESEGARRTEDFQSKHLNRPSLAFLARPARGNRAAGVHGAAGGGGLRAANRGANVAHLLLSRITERRQELAIRGALARARAPSPAMITECMLLTSRGRGRLLVAFWSAWLPIAFSLRSGGATSTTILDWRVLGSRWRSPPSRACCSACCRPA